MNEAAGSVETPTSSSVDAVVVRDGVAAASVERVAEEAAIAFEVNGIAHAVMLATPADLDDFALGFLLGEGIVDRRADVLDVEGEPQAGGIALRVTVVQRCASRLKERRRVMAGRTGCGICGTDSIAEALRPVARVAPHAPFDAAALIAGMAALGASQRLQRETGATHAAAWIRRDGTLAFVREDVGRHNALDKLVGAMAREGVDPASGFVAVTSRASFEMVHKTAAAGVGLIAAISAPTGLAVRLAAEAGVTLAGFARGSQATLYSHPHGVRAGPG